MKIFFWKIFKYVTFPSTPPACRRLRDVTPSTHPSLSFSYIKTLLLHDGYYHTLCSGVPPASLCVLFCFFFPSKIPSSWLAFEGPDFTGRMYVLEVGSYSDLRAMGCSQASTSILSMQTTGFVRLWLFHCFLAYFRAALPLPFIEDQICSFKFDLYIFIHLPATLLGISVWLFMNAKSWSVSRMNRLARSKLGITLGSEKEIDVTLNMVNTVFALRTWRTADLQGYSTISQV